VVDVVFCVDMVLQFFIMYRAPEHSSGWASAADIGERWGEAKPAATPDDDGASANFPPTALTRADTHHILSSTGVLYVADPGKIRRRYIFSAWFVLDILSIAPSVRTGARTLALVTPSSALSPASTSSNSTCVRSPVRTSWARAT
jgi:hypothetical protein